MKKLLFLAFTFLVGLNICFASNKIKNIDIVVYIDENGTANIRETWNVDGSDGTEWYKVVNLPEDMVLTDFKVSMDGNELTYKEWDINETLREKKGYYGVVRTSTGYELCFGKYDYLNHVFTLEYNISNFVFNTNDAQVIYFNFIDRLSDVDFRNFTLEINSYYKFPDTLPVWGYGYKGYAYVSNGRILMSNYEKEKMTDKYVVLLAQFPLNTFATANSYSNFETFEDVLNSSSQGSFSYNYDDEFDFAVFIEIFLYIAFFFVTTIVTAKAHERNKYGYIDNKVIDKKNTPYYRDIPCNKDIYYANALVSMNVDLFSAASVKDTNILGAILLKWIKNGILTVKKEEKTSLLGTKESVSLIMNGKDKIENLQEQELYDVIYTASKDGILESKELENYAKKNYTKFFKLFEKIKDSKIEDLKSKNYVFTRQDKKQCKYKNVMSDALYDETTKLYGLKLFLDEFSNIKEREAIEVNLWDEYLMYAYLFGNAKKVMQQFKNLYPEVIKEMDQYNMDYDILIVLNNISYNSVSAASSARAAAQSYSSGGGGFSSGGGGGGSFGGGGGGSR